MQIKIKNKIILIDNEDYNNISKHRWLMHSLGYVYSYINGKTVYLHRFIMGSNSNLIVDHINGDRLDNRRINLRLCTIKENVRNCKTSKNSITGYTGVSYRPDRGKYRAYIMVDRKQIALGNFKDIELAIQARRKAELIYFGEFSPTLTGVNLK